MPNATEQVEESKEDGKDDDEPHEVEIRDCRKHGYKLCDRFLGKGSYAKVFLAEPTLSKIRFNDKLLKLKRKCRTLQVAVKIVRLECVSESYINKYLPREVSTMSQSYGHRNVIKLLDFFATRKRVYLVLEHAPCGDLRTMINRKFSRHHQGTTEEMNEAVAREIFRNIGAGLRFLHSRDIAHRDLKLENVLLGRNNLAKLSDFGFAFKQGEEHELRNTHCGSYSYVAPEILKKQTYEAKAADIWSLGVILFAMTQGFLPFKANSARGTLEAFKKTVHFKREISSDCKDLIRALIRKKPINRITADQVMRHPWLNPPLLNLDEDIQVRVSRGTQQTEERYCRPVFESRSFIASNNPLYRTPKPSCRLDDAEFIARYIDRVVRCRYGGGPTTVRRSKKPVPTPAIRNSPSIKQLGAATKVAPRHDKPLVTSQRKEMEPSARRTSKPPPPPPSPSDKKKSKLQKKANHNSTTKLLKTLEKQLSQASLQPETQTTTTRPPPKQQQVCAREKHTRELTSCKKKHRPSRCEMEPMAVGDCPSASSQLRPKTSATTRGRNDDAPRPSATGSNLRPFRALLSRREREAAARKAKTGKEQRRPAWHF